MKIKVFPYGDEIEVDKGNNLLKVLLNNGYFIPSICGGRGKCRKCKVKIITEEISNDNKNISHSSSKSKLKKKTKSVLACQTKLFQDTTIYIKEHKSCQIRSIFLENGEKELSKARKRKKHIKKSGEFGIAVDVGTTTIAGSLLDRESGERLAYHSVFNPQFNYGSDVISRISFSLSCKEGLKILREEVIRGINNIVLKLVKDVGIKNEYISMMVLTGNTCMTHILAGVSLKTLASVPFEPAFKNSLNYKASDLGIKINKRASVYITPLIAGFVGGDTVSMISHLDLHSKTGNVMAVDIGTNGEIVAKRDGEIFCCSVAAGPALEGGNIKFGMRAERGAIEKVFLDNKGNLQYKVVGGIKPTGICGSGLIELIGLLLVNKVVNSMGHIIKHDSSSMFYKNILKGEDQKFFFVIDKKISLTQEDIYQVMLAKSAIRSGIEVLLEQLKIRADDIEKVFLSGNFTINLEEESFISLGILPKEFRGKIINVGNAALAGAEEMLISKDKRKQAEIISRKVNYIELASREDFKNEFIDNLPFR